MCATEDSNQAVHPSSLVILCMDDHHENMPIYIFDPLEPHFYIVKSGVVGIIIIFLISDLKHRLCVLVRTASNLGFVQKQEKYFNFLSGIVHFRQ